MLAVVVLTTALNIAYCALLIGDDPYGQIEPVREAAMSIVATCTAFSGVFGVYGAMKADRSSLILTLSFFLSTAATIRFDVLQAASGYTVLAVVAVAMNLLSGWAAMDYSEATQAKTQGHDAYWVSPKVLAKIVIPALSVCHLVLAILKYYFTVVTNTFEATVIAPAGWPSEKLYWELKLAMFALATWNLLTSVCSVVAVSQYGQATLGRLALVTVAGMALVGAILQFFPLNNIILAHSKMQSMCDDCPDLGYFVGSDICTERANLTGLVMTMFGSWIVNVLLVISAWTLSEERQEVGDTVHGPDVSAGRHAKTLLTANHWLCNVLGVLAGCYLLQFVVYAYSDESYPDTVYGFVKAKGNPDTTESDAAGVLPKEGDGMVQKRWLALLSACLTAAVVALDWIGRERSVHDADRVASYTKFLLAGTVLVSYMVTVSFVQVISAGAEVSFGQTVYHPKGLDGTTSWDLAGDTCARVFGPARRQLETNICSYNIAAWGRELHNPAFEAVMRLGPVQKPTWGRFCGAGWAAYTTAYTEHSAVLPPTANDTAGIAAWAAVSERARQCNADNGWTVKPIFQEYSAVGKGLNMSALLIAIAALAVSILLVIITLALSEAEEDTHHLVRRMTWKARLSSPGLTAPEIEGDQADDQGQAVARLPSDKKLDFVLSSV